MTDPTPTTDLAALREDHDRLAEAVTELVARCESAELRLAEHTAAAGQRLSELNTAHQRLEQLVDVIHKGTDKLLNRHEQRLTDGVAQHNDLADELRNELRELHRQVLDADRESERRDRSLEQDVDAVRSDLQALRADVSRASSGW